MPKNVTHQGVAGPASHFGPVSPSDVTDLARGVSRSLFVGGAGTITVRGADGSEATFNSGAAQYHPIRVARVLATGTTASEIIALY